MRRRTPPSRRVEDVDAAPLRRIGRQLAILLVALLCTLLLALLAVVYFRTRASSLESLRDTLRTSAQSEVSDVTKLAEPSHKKGRIVHESKEEEQERGEVFITFADAQLKYVGGSSGPFGAALADRSAAARALRGTSPVFSTVETPGDLTYLICTVPAILHGQAVGVVQTGSSERTYEQSLKALLESLFLVSVFGLAASAGITWLVVHRALAPIRSALSHQREFVADAAHELRARSPSCVRRLSCGWSPAATMTSRKRLNRCFLREHTLPAWLMTSPCWLERTAAR